MALQELQKPANSLEKVGQRVSPATRELRTCELCKEYFYSGDNCPCKRFDLKYRCGFPDPKQYYAFKFIEKYKPITVYAETIIQASKKVLHEIVFHGHIDLGDRRFYSCGDRCAVQVEYNGNVWQVESLVKLEIKTKKLKTP